MSILCKYEHSEERRVVNGQCRECARVSRALYRANNPDKIREQKRLSHIRNRDKNLARSRAFNSTNSEVLLVRRRKRGGLPNPTHPCPPLCECCGGPPGRKRMHLDHCHTSGVFRGWLCSKCNWGVGKLGDSIAGLMNAVRYLERAAEVKT